MKRFILAFSMFSVWLAIASTYYVCAIKGLCGDTSNTDETPAITKKPIIKKQVALDSLSNLASAEKKPDSITNAEAKVAPIDTLKTSGLKIFDNKNLLKSYYSNFRTYKNATNVRIPMGISEYGYVLAKHMDSVNSALIIKGYFNQEETPEKGEQRATNIKERLIKLGIPETLIDIASVPAIYEYNNNKFIGGIQFDFKKTDTVFRLKRVDYTLFKNNKEEIAIENNENEIIVEPTNVSKISDVDLNTITKKEPTITPPVNTKPKVPVTTAKEKILFTVTERNFRNNKFKPSKSFKTFLETYKNSKNIKLMGYSNSSENTTDNYKKGILLANLVNRYITNKGSYEGKTITSALKNQKFTTNDTIREGVTLIIQ